MMLTRDSTPSARYAPSPTGTLHLGNLRTALASYLSARSRGFRYLLRVEDLDGARCREEFEERQLGDLRELGIAWDAAPIRQSNRTDVYTKAFEILRLRRLVYPCFCSRREIAEALSAPHAGGGNAYPGTCRELEPGEADRRLADGRQHCWRLRVDQAPKVFFDGFAGEVPLDLEIDGGDFVIRRADGYFAYQLACAVDDALSGVVEVLRGADLLDSGARQAYLLACLGFAAPRYLHIPLMMAADGRRLAKRIGSEDLSGFASRGFDAATVRAYLAHTLGLVELGERPAMEELVRRWDVARIPREPVPFDEQTLAAFRL